MESINDSLNLVGITNLTNKTRLNTQERPDEVENEMVGVENIGSTPEVDPAEEFRNTIRELSANTGIDLMDPEERTEEYVEEIPAAPMGVPAPMAIPAARSMHRESGVFNVPPPLQFGAAANPATAGSAGVPRYTPAFRDPRQAHLNNALRTYAGNVNLMDKENEEDIKSIMLEDIDQLRYELGNEHIDLSRIPEVDTSSALGEVQKIHKILQKKYDRKRCDQFGTELILASAQGLEYLFDGNRKWGPYSPDLTGWHNTIRPKLRRMRYETSTIMSNIMREYDMGPLWRIALELLPSAVLYSHTRKAQYQQANYTPDQMSEAYDDLRQYE